MSMDKNLDQFDNPRPSTSADGSSFVPSQHNLSAGPLKTLLRKQAHAVRAWKRQTYNDLRRENGLKAHLNLNTRSIDDLSFRCKSCCCKFNSAEVLAVHVKSIHNDKNDRHSFPAVALKHVHNFMNDGVSLADFRLVLRRRNKLRSRQAVLLPNDDSTKAGVNEHEKSVSLSPDLSDGPKSFTSNKCSLLAYNSTVIQNQPPSLTPIAPKPQTLLSTMSVEEIATKTPQDGLDHLYLGQMSTVAKPARLPRRPAKVDDFISFCRSGDYFSRLLNNSGGARTAPTPATQLKPSAIGSPSLAQSQPICDKAVLYNCPPDSLSYSKILGVTKVRESERSDLKHVFHNRAMLTAKSAVFPSPVIPTVGPNVQPGHPGGNPKSSNQQRVLNSTQRGATTTILDRISKMLRKRKWSGPKTTECARYWAKRVVNTVDWPKRPKNARTYPKTTEITYSNYSKTAKNTDNSPKMDLILQTQRTLPAPNPASYKNNMPLIPHDYNNGIKSLPPISVSPHQFGPLGPKSLQPYLLTSHEPTNRARPVDINQAAAHSHDYANKSGKEKVFYDLSTSLDLSMFRLVKL